MRKFILIIVSVLLFTCCSKKSSSNSADNSTPITIHHFSDSFFYDNDLYFNNLKLVNKVTDNEYAICNIPGCLHASDECLTKKFSVSASFSAVYDNHVLFMDESKRKVYFVDTDGNNLQEVLDFGNLSNLQAQESVLVGNHFYIIASLGNQTMDNTGFMIDIDGFIRVYDFDMDAKSCRVLYESPKMVHAQALSSLLYNNGFLCFFYEDQSKTIRETGMTPVEFYNSYMGDIRIKNELLGIQYHTVILDIESRNSHEIEWNGSDNPDNPMPLFPSGFINHTLYSYDENGIYSYDLMTNQSATCYSDSAFSSYLVMQSADFVFMRYQKENEAHYLILTEEGTIREKIQPLENAFTIIEECYHQIVIQFYDGSTRFGTFEPDKCKRVSRSEFKKWFK